jgi:ATP-dependent RNA helicase DDX27
MSVDGEDEGDEEDDGSESDAESVESATETARKHAFFAQDPSANEDPTLPTSFSSMNLSRPLLRALSSLQFSTPTPIQARAVPLALLGRDILGSAVTGSGKTGAFMIPILERLTYRDRGKGGQACRVLVLCPTRELAVQKREGWTSDSLFSSEDCPSMLRRTPCAPCRMCSSPRQVD